MFNYNINIMTIILNISFLIVLIFYFLVTELSFEDKRKNSNKYEKLINTEIILSNSIPKIDIGSIDLPKLNIVETKSYNKQNLLLKPIIYIKREKKKSISHIKKLPNSNFLNIIKNKTHKIIPLKNKIKDVHFNKKKVEELTQIGSDFIKNNRNFFFEFSWPSNTSDHDKIYNILNLCLKSQTVLMDKNNNIFGLKGLITKSDFTKNFSLIIRAPSFVYSSLEKKNLNIIRSQYLDGFSGKHLRLFKKNIDAYIMGFFYNLAKKKQLSLKNIKGNYKIIKNKLYLDNIRINSISIKNKLLLSSLNNKCNV